MCLVLLITLCLAAWPALGEDIMVTRIDPPGDGKWDDNFWDYTPAPSPITVYPRDLLGNNYFVDIGDFNVDLGPFPGGLNSAEPNSFVDLAFAANIQGGELEAIGSGLIRVTAAPLAPAPARQYC